MEAFWAMSDWEKFTFLGKILVFGFGWAALILSSIVILLLVIDGYRDWRQERLEKKAERQKERRASRIQRHKVEQLQAYSVGIAPARPNAHWADDTTDVFMIAEEIYK